MASEERAEHRFGGPWTELKLEAVEYYLRFYTRALQGKPTPERPFELWYVDAFAGTGDRESSRAVGGLHEGTPVELQTVRLAGSAQRALAVDPPFHRLFFIEERPEFCATLDLLRRANPARDVRCIQGDANQELPAIFGAPPWTGPRLGRQPARGVVFLDHYDIVEWSTLQSLAHTRAVDVWYLFPIWSVLRQAARDFGAIDDHKARYLDRAFGTPQWRTDLYQPVAQAPLLASLEGAPQRGGRAEVEAYAKARLETLFPYVSQPLPLLAPGGAQLFSLFFAVANPSETAKNLAKKCVRDLLRRFGPQVARRRSAP